MIAPCRNCARRTAMPNCHASCEEYAMYAAYRQKVREARQREHEANSARIVGASKIRAEVWRRKRNG